MSSALTIGSKGPQVLRLQQALRTANFRDAQGAELNPDGDFGARTAAAVRTFQVFAGLPATGAVEWAWVDLLDGRAAAPTPLKISTPNEDAFDFDAFEKSIIDRRPFHAPYYRDASKKPHPYTPQKRPIAETTGICLHQTACQLGERAERYDTLSIHFGIPRSGRVIQMAAVDEILFGGNGWNNHTIQIEVDGLYPGLEDDPDTAQDEAMRTTWDDPTTPTRETPQKVTPQAMRSLRNLIRYLDEKMRRLGGKIKVLVAHRQASGDRQNDPGQAIWEQAAVPLHKELGLEDGGVGFKIPDSTGYAIPQAWDERCRGVKY